MKFRGVSNHKEGGFVANIGHNGKHVYLGHFREFDTAKQARCGGNRMRDTINTDRHIYPLPVGYRVFWAEDTGNDGVRLLEMDCVADDFGDLVGVPRNSRAVLTNDAKGWAYRAAKSEAAV